MFSKGFSKYDILLLVELDLAHSYLKFSQPMLKVRMSVVLVRGSLQVRQDRC